MIKTAVAIFFLLVSFSTNAEIYKWTDSQGDVHFTDQPTPGSEKVAIPDSQSSIPSPAPTPTPEQNTLPNTDTADTNRQYNQFSIVQPKTEETIRNNQGYAAVIFEVEPKLKSGDKIQLLYDGKPLGDAKETTLFALNNVDRGTHTVSGQILDESGQVVNTTETVTFYMHRPRVGMTNPANK